MGELLGALGLAWPRILLYPGGLFALVAAWLLDRWLRRCRAGAGWPAHGTGPAGGGGLGQGLAPLALVAPLAVLTLLPLAPARSFPYGLDLVAAIALLELPRLLALRELDRERLGREYAPLLVAALGMTSAVGSAGLSRLLLPPEGWRARALLAAGTVLWLLALPRLLPGGADAPGAPRTAQAAPSTPPAEQLRALGLLLIGVLPLLGALAAGTAALLPAGMAGWVLPPAAMLIAAAALGGLLRLPAWALERARLALGVLILALVGLGALGV